MDSTEYQGIVEKFTELIERSEDAMGAFASHLVRTPLTARALYALLYNHDIRFDQNALSDWRKKLSKR